MIVKVLFAICSFVFFTINTLWAQNNENKFIKLYLSEHCKTMFVKKNVNQDVYFKIIFGKNEDFKSFLKNQSSLVLHWKVRNKPDEDAVLGDSMKISNDNMVIGTDYFELKITTPFLLKNTSQFLNLKFSNNSLGINYSMHERITNTDEITFPFFVHKTYSKFPLQDQYCNLNDTLGFTSNLEKDSIVIEYQSETDSIALPPMFLGEYPYAKNQKYTKSKIAFDTKFIPQKTGLYTFSYLNNSNKFSIVVLNGKFPTFTKAKELVNVLHYIITNDERANLLTAENTKTALDEFLINLTGDKNLAKDIVKNYFKRTTEANQLFTNTKEGWKTDKGMVYMIFGKPDRVYFEDGHEDWSYEKNALYNELNFYFKKKNSAEGYFYELERMKDYHEIWNSIIGKWRRGLIK